MNCAHCSDPLAEWSCGDTEYGHNGLCCSCMDLSCGQPIEDVNDERAEDKRKLVDPWGRVPANHDPGDEDRR